MHKGNDFTNAQKKSTNFKFSSLKSSQISTNHNDPFGILWGNFEIRRFKFVKLI